MADLKQVNLIWGSHVMDPVTGVIFNDEMGELATALIPALELSGLAQTTLLFQARRMPSVFSQAHGTTQLHGRSARPTFSSLNADFGLDHSPRPHHQSYSTTTPPFTQSLEVPAALVSSPPSHK